MTDREPALETARRLEYSISLGTADATPEQRRLQDEVKTRCVCLSAIVDALLEAKAQGVELVGEEMHYWLSATLEREEAIRVSTLARGYANKIREQKGGGK